MEPNTPVKITWDYGPPDEIRQGGFGKVEIYRSYKIAIKTIPNNAVSAEVWREVCLYY
jgi:hypothetical protein